MNIFATDNNPIQSAIYLDDKRVIKMALESTQMLSTAINECGGKAPYKSTHKNHPANVWTRQTRQNFDWLLAHAKALSTEYTYRYGKIHKCLGILSNIEEQNLNLLVPNGSLTTFANCAAHKGKEISFKHIADVTEAYKQYLNLRWETDVRKPTWTNRTIPEFYIVGKL